MSQSAMYGLGNCKANEVLPDFGAPTKSRPNAGRGDWDAVVFINNNGCAGIGASLLLWFQLSPELFSFDAGNDRLRVTMVEVFEGL